MSRFEKILFWAWSAIFGLFVALFFILSFISRDRIYEGRLEIKESKVLESSDFALGNIESSSEFTRNSTLKNIESKSDFIEYVAKLKFKNQLFRAQRDLSDIEIIDFKFADSSLDSKTDSIESSTHNNGGGGESLLDSKNSNANSAISNDTKNQKNISNKDSKIIESNLQNSNKLQNLDSKTQDSIKNSTNFTESNSQNLTKDSKIFTESNLQDSIKNSNKSQNLDSKNIESTKFQNYKIYNFTHPNNQNKIIFIMPSDKNPPLTFTYKTHFKLSFLAKLLKYYICGILILAAFIYRKNIINFIYFIYTSKYKKEILAVSIFIVFIATTFSFYNNSFHIVSDGYFNSWQKDTESSVVGKIIADINGENTFGYGLVYPVEKYPTDKEALQIYNMLEYNIKPQGYWSYRSSIGLQGFMASFLYRILEHKKLQNLDSKTQDFNKLQNLDFKNFKDFKNPILKLNFLAAALSAFVMILTSYLFARIFGNLFGVIFFISLFFSTWIVNYGNNLYHLIFMWFLPAIFSCMLFLRLNKVGKMDRICILLLVLFTLSFSLRAACSYEYITSITIFAIAPFMLAPFMAGLRDGVFKTRSFSFRLSLKYVILLFALAIFGFMITFLYHASLRGDGDLLLGLENIYRQDYLRRMIGGSASEFPGYADSMNASVFSVVSKYTFYDVWKNVLFALSVLGLGVLFARDKARGVACSAMLFIFGVGALSWYVLGKGHSYYHGHMNYVLWFLGFYAAMLYTIALSVLECYKMYGKRFVVKRE